MTFDGVHGIFALQLYFSILSYQLRTGFKKLKNNRIKNHNYIDNSSIKKIQL